MLLQNVDKITISYGKQFNLFKTNVISIDLANQQASTLKTMFL